MNSDDKLDAAIRLAKEQALLARARAARQAQQPVDPMQQTAPPPAAPAQQLALPSTAGPPQSFQPSTDIWTFHIPETESHMLGNKGYLALRAMVAAINAYNASNPGTLIDIRSIQKSHFGSSSEEMKFYRDIIRGKVQITFGNDKRLVNK